MKRSKQAEAIAPAVLCDQPTDQRLSPMVSFPVSRALLIEHVFSGFCAASHEPACAAVTKSCHSPIVLAVLATDVFLSGFPSLGTLNVVCTALNLPVTFNCARRLEAFHFALSLRRSQLVASAFDLFLRQMAEEVTNTFNCVEMFSFDELTGVAAQHHINLERSTNKGLRDALSARSCGTLSTAWSNCMSRACARLG
jgi:hypothetical protein